MAGVDLQRTVVGDSQSAEPREAGGIVGWPELLDDDEGTTGPPEDPPRRRREDRGQDFSLPEGFARAPAAEADPDLRAEAAAAVIAAARGVGAQAFGLAETSAQTISVVNSLGIDVSEQRSRARVMTVMMGPGGSTGYAERVSVGLFDYPVLQAADILAFLVRELAIDVPLDFGG
mgnify:CR=1 FL=1